MRARPAGLSLLATVLILLALAAFVLALTAEAVAMLEGARWRLIQVGALIYGVTAIVAAVGLWRLRRWGYLAFVGWVGAVLLAGLLTPVVVPRSHLPWWASLVWIGLVALIALPLARYVRRAISPTL
jgi:uncharacterized membrane protein (DUF2068 family)